MGKRKREYSELGDKSQLYYRTPPYSEHISERVIATAEVSNEVLREALKGNPIKNVSGAVYQDFKGFNRIDNEQDYVNNRSYRTYGDAVGYDVYNTRNLAAAHTSGIHIEFEKGESEEVNARLSRTTLQPHPANSHGPDRVVDKRQLEYFQNFDPKAYRQNTEGYFYNKFVEPLQKELEFKKDNSRNSKYPQYKADFDGAINALSAFSDLSAPNAKKQKKNPFQIEEVSPLDSLETTLRSGQSMLSEDSVMNHFNYLFYSGTVPMPNQEEQKEPYFE